ncbi:hypothetical protein FGO68_gene14532 [Halteria grandinella]|uniref:Uncharacterized protein n=1 Tax=Halteria grandinella TaxID=5974 RepID=A0A8J8P690_HALGN|nr:hypothetical protein FGO68_gene14532 [Halteria grandinella]
MERQASIAVLDQPIPMNYKPLKQIMEEQHAPLVTFGACSPDSPQKDSCAFSDTPFSSSSRCSPNQLKDGAADCAGQDFTMGGYLLYKDPPNKKRTSEKSTDQNLLCKSDHASNQSTKYVEPKLSHLSKNAHQLKQEERQLQQIIQRETKQQENDESTRKMQIELAVKDTLPLYKDYDDQDSSSSESVDCMQIQTKQNGLNSITATTHVTNDLNLAAISRMASISSTMRMRDFTQSMKNIEFVDDHDPHDDEINRNSNLSISSFRFGAGNVKSAQENKRAFSGLTPCSLKDFQYKPQSPPRLNREYTQSNDLRKLQLQLYQQRHNNNRRMSLQPNGPLPLTGDTNICLATTSILLGQSNSSGKGEQNGSNTGLTTEIQIIERRSSTPIKVPKNCPPVFRRRISQNPSSSFISSALKAQLKGQNFPETPQPIKNSSNNGNQVAFPEVNFHSHKKIQTPLVQQQQLLGNAKQEKHSESMTAINAYGVSFDGAVNDARSLVSLMQNLQPSIYSPLKVQNNWLSSHNRVGSGEEHKQCISKVQNVGLTQFPQFESQVQAAVPQRDAPQPQHDEQLAYTKLPSMLDLPLTGEETLPSICSKIQTAHQSRIISGDTNSIQRSMDNQIKAGKEEGSGLASGINRAQQMPTVEYFRDRAAKKKLSPPIAMQLDQFLEQEIDATSSIQRSEDDVKNQTASFNQVAIGALASDDSHGYSGLMNIYNKFMFQNKQAPFNSSTSDQSLNLLTPSSPKINGARFEPISLNDEGMTLRQPNLQGSDSRDVELLEQVALYQSDKEEQVERQQQRTAFREDNEAFTQSHLLKHHLNQHGVQDKLRHLRDIRVSSANNDVDYQDSHANPYIEQQDQSILRRAVIEENEDSFDINNKIIRQPQTPMPQQQQDPVIQLTATSNWMAHRLQRSMSPPVLNKSGIDAKQAFAFKFNIIQLGHVAEAENEEESLQAYKIPRRKSLFPQAQQQLIVEELSVSYNQSIKQDVPEDIEVSSQSGFHEEEPERFEQSAKYHLLKGTEIGVGSRIKVGGKTDKGGAGNSPSLFTYQHVNNGGAPEGLQAMGGLKLASDMMILHTEDIDEFLHEDAEESLEERIKIPSTANINTNKSSIMQAKSYLSLKIDAKLGSDYESDEDLEAEDHRISQREGDSANDCLEFHSNHKNMKKPDLTQAFLALAGAPLSELYSNGKQTTSGFVHQPMRSAARVSDSENTFYARKASMIEEDLARRQSISEALGARKISFGANANQKHSHSQSNSPLAQ